MDFHKGNQNENQSANVSAIRRRYLVRLSKGVQFKERRGMGGVSITGVVMLAVGLLVAASIFPDAVSTINDANTTGWDATTVTLWGLIGTFAVIGLALSVLGFRD